MNSVRQGNMVAVNNDILKWFKEECLVRCFASGIWSVGIFQVVIFIFLFAVNVSIFSPIQWVSNSVGLLFSLQMVFSVVVLQTFCFLIAVFHSKCINVQLARFWKRIDFFYHLLQPKQIASFVINTFTAITVGYVLRKLCYYQSSEETDWFLFGLFIFLGGYYTFDFHARSKNTVQFPIINQKRIFRIKKNFWKCLKDTSLIGIKALRYYYPAYIVLGILPRCIIKFLFNPSITSGSSCLSLVFNLFDVSLLWLCFCITMTTVFMINITNEMLHVYLTEHFEFSLEGEVLLMKAIVSDNLVLKHLSWYDLSILSKRENSRRLKLYELTPPGSQAHTWNSICIETIGLMENMASSLKKEIELKQFYKINKKFVESTSSVNTVGAQPLLSTDDHSSDDSLWNRKVKLPYDGVSNLQNEFLKRKNEVGQPNKKLFEHIQILFWCIEGLSNLIAASIKEDRYGVVQMKLSDALPSMLDLLECCESFTKVSISPSSSLNINDKLNQHQMQTASSLKIVLKTAIYTITTAFGSHISAVRLSNDHQKRIHAFIEMVD